MLWKITMTFRTFTAILRMPDYFYCMRDAIPKQHIFPKEAELRGHSVRNVLFLVGATSPGLGATSE